MKPTTGFIDASHGVRLYYEFYGSEAPYVIVPNALFMARDFAHLAGSRTMVFFDGRNRGRSEWDGTPGAFARGIHHDVDDLETVRRHFGVDRISIIGHSYCAAYAVLYAREYPEHTGRVVQVGPTQPDWSKQYPAELMNHDETFVRVMTALQQFKPQPDAIATCRQFWELLRPLYVTDPADVDKLPGDACAFANERAFLKHLAGSGDALPHFPALDARSPRACRCTCAYDPRS